MEIWLDTSDVDLVASVNNLGILHGVTTNPTIVSTSKMSPQELIENLLEKQRGPIAVQVLSNEGKEMVREAKALNSISSRIIVKIPVTQTGLYALHALHQEGIPTLATAIYEVRQALFAFKAGASYLAPYLGRIADTGEDPVQTLSKMQTLKTQYGFNGKIMGAGIRDQQIVASCIEVGISAITLPDKVFTTFIEDSKGTLLALEKFANDWSQSQHVGHELSCLLLGRK